MSVSRGAGAPSLVPHVEKEFIGWVPTRADLTGRSHASRRLSRRRALQTGGLAALGAGLARVSAARAQDNLATAPAATPFASPVASPEAGMGVTPERVRAAIEALDGVVDNALATTGVPGMAVAVVYRDQVVYLKGFGVREAGTAEAVDADTVFQLASVSKPIASTVVAAVVGDGRHLGRPVVEHRPRLRAERPLGDAARSRCATCSPTAAACRTTRATCWKTSATTGPRSCAGCATSSRRTASAPATPTPTSASPRRRWRRRGRPGTSWEELSAERLYRPLGMTRTSSRFADYAAAPNRAVTARARSTARGRPKYVARRRRPVAGRRRQLHRAGHGAVAAAAARRRQVRRPADRRRRGAGRDPPCRRSSRRAAGIPGHGRAGFYGLGWNVGYDDEGRLRLSHSGAFELGAGTTVSLLPAERARHRRPHQRRAAIGVPEAIAVSFLDLGRFGRSGSDYLAGLEPIFAAVLAQPTARWSTTTRQASPGPPLSLKAYSEPMPTNSGARWRSNAQDALVLRLGPNSCRSRCATRSATSYAYQPAGENAYGPSGVTFEIGPDGRASDVVVELDIHGQGTFEPNYHVAVPRGRWPRTGLRAGGVAARDLHRRRRRPLACVRRRQRPSRPSRSGRRPAGRDRDRHARSGRPTVTDELADALGRLLIVCMFADIARRLARPAHQ